VGKEHPPHPRVALAEDGHSTMDQQLSAKAHFADSAELG
jgi:hypothetical protein